MCRATSTLEMVSLRRGTPVWHEYVLAAGLPSAVEMDVVKACAMRLHDFIFVADFSDVSVCTTLFLSRFAGRYFCRGRFGLHDVFFRGFFGRFSLHVLFVANFSDASVCMTLFLSRNFWSFSLHVLLLRIFRTLQFARRYFCSLLLPFACDAPRAFG